MKHLITSQALQKRSVQLQVAKPTLWEQQKPIIEEERLKVLLQVAGATASELNQPLQALVGNIELMKAHANNPQEIVKYLRGIEDAGQRISNIVQKFQHIRHDSAAACLDNTAVINFEQKIKILSVEDPDDDFAFLHSILEDQNQITLKRVSSIDKAMKALEKSEFDLILLGYFLSDGNGLDFLKMINEKGMTIPTVVITGRGSEMIASQVVKAGADDYLPKEILNHQSLTRTIANALERSRLKREIRKALNKMAEMTMSDDLTGLYNRRYFMEAMEREISRSKRYNSGFSLSMIDLDYFKQTNDSHGHPAGDRALSEVGKMLRKSIRQSDLACRYGGEEFAVILPSTQADKALTVFERFRKRIAKHRFEYNASKFNLTVSVGITSLSHHKEPSTMKLLEAADQALYQAKKEGRNRVRVITP